ncbi:unnamed protein product, partial [Prorocentrum cordatum]
AQGSNRPAALQHLAGLSQDGPAPWRSPAGTSARRRGARGPSRSRACGGAGRGSVLWPVVPDVRQHPRYATELGASCVYVEYEGNVPNSSALSVRNSVSVLGFRVDVTGYATPSPHRAGEFEVALGPPGHPPAQPPAFTAANFVVVALGPVVDRRYDFAVITDPTLLSLYVLARDVGRFRSRYEARVLSTVTEMGFSSILNRPLRTNQVGCRYPPASGEEPVLIV